MVECAHTHTHRQKQGQRENERKNVERKSWREREREKISEKLTNRWSLAWSSFSKQKNLFRWLSPFFFFYHGNWVSMGDGYILAMNWGMKKGQSSYRMNRHFSCTSIILVACVLFSLPTCDFLEEMGPSVSPSFFFRSFWFMCYVCSGYFFVIPFFFMCFLLLSSLHIHINLDVCLRGCVRICILVCEWIQMCAIACVGSECVFLENS